jgi:hypothetical protein
MVETGCFQDYGSTGFNLYSPYRSRRVEPRLLRRAERRQALQPPVPRPPPPQRRRLAPRGGIITIRIYR